MKIPVYKNDKVLLLEKDPSESINIFYDRAYFILAQLDNNIEKNKAITYSYIYVNVKKFGMRYNENIMEILLGFEANMCSGIL